MSSLRVRRYQKTEEDGSPDNKPVAESHRKQAGVVRGILVGLNQDGVAMVDFERNPEREPLPAISTVILGKRDKGREAVLMFEDGNPRRPILLGLVQPPTPPAEPQPRVELSLDGERVVLNGEKEVVLRCGEASITLTRAGKVLIRGAYLLSRSSGVNRIKGGSIQLN